MARGGRTVWGAPVRREFARAKGFRFGALASLGVLAATVELGLVAEAGAGDVFSYRDPRGVQYFTNVPTDRKFRAFTLPKERLTMLSFRRGQTAVSAARKFARLEMTSEIRSMINDTADRFDLEPALVAAVVRAESGFNPQAVSSAGAQGLMQLMPGTALEVGVRDVFHPQENLEGGVSYLRNMIDRFGNVQLGLAAYNAGPGAVENHGGVPPFPETREYLRRVFQFRQEYLYDALRQRQTLASSARALSR